MAGDLDALQLREIDGGTVMPLKVTAGGRRNALGDVHDGRLRVTVTAAAEKGKANRAVIDLMSSALGIPKSDLQITAGQTQSRKSLLVAGRDSAVVIQLLRVAGY